MSKWHWRMLAVGSVRGLAPPAIICAALSCKQVPSRPRTQAEELAYWKTKCAAQEEKVRCFAAVLPAPSSAFPAALQTRASAHVPLQISKLQVQSSDLTSQLVAATEANAKSRDEVSLACLVFSAAYRPTSTLRTVPM